MAEILGLLASIATLTAAIKYGIVKVKETYAATDELGSLMKKEQVETLENLITNIKKIGLGASVKVPAAALSRTEKILQDTKHLVHTKLLRHKNGSNRARRRAWLGNKSKIARFRRQLAEASETISAAISVTTLTSLDETQASLSTLDRQFAEAKNTAAETDRTLLDLCTQSRDNGKILQKILLCTYFPQERSIRRVFGGSHVQVLSGLKDQVDTADDKENASERILFDVRDHSNKNEKLSFFSLTSMSSPFERSSSFMPETYAVNNRVPKFFCYSGFEETSSPFARINRYEILLARNPRSWIHLAIHVTVSANSRYWDSEKLTPRIDTAYWYPRGRSFPKALYPPLAHLFTSRPNVEEGSCISLDLHPDNDDERNQQCNLQAYISKPVGGITGYLREVTQELRYMSCPRHMEEDLIQRPLHEDPRTHEFVTFVGSKWVRDFRFSNNSNHTERLLYTLRLQHCLDGVPGAARLYGLVLCREGYVRSFLSELPKCGLIFDFMAREHEKGSPVSWERREKWIRQIVGVVGKIHSRGFVVGSLGLVRHTAVAIDGDDNAVLFYFRNYLRHGLGCRSFSDSDEVRITPAMDMFDLGMTVWLVAGYHTTEGYDVFCRAVGCTTPTTNTSRCEEHFNPLELPDLGPTVPEYIKSIIGACRQPDESLRPPAWELLEMFPDVEGIPEDDAGVPTGSRYVIRFEDCQAAYPRLVSCDRCGKRIRHYYYHCKVCYNNDYDICQGCFADGFHCENQAHFLVEYVVQGDGKLGTGSYHSSVKQDGERTVLSL